MRTALIGHTGFVGGTLKQQAVFTDLYNSSNIHELATQEYDRVYIAAPSAVKWYANRHPEEDLAHVSKLIEQLMTMHSRKVVLLSTVDVYPSPIDVDEDSEIQIDQCQPYGRHRLMLEAQLAERFDTTVIRLPGLFGTGLKKNIIFDFLHQNDIHKIDTRSSFQFYPLRHLTRDIEQALESGFSLLNMAVEPIPTTTVAEICLGYSYENVALPAPVRYDFRSKHAPRFGGERGYLYSQDRVIEELRLFVAQEQKNRVAPEVRQ